MTDRLPKAGPPIDGTEPICRKESPSAADVIADLRRQLAEAVGMLREVDEEYLDDWKCKPGCNCLVHRVRRLLEEHRA